MKKILAFTLVFWLIALALVSCQNIEKHEEYYAHKSIRISVSHISGFDAQPEYDVYFENIKKGESYALPSGNANPYKVTVTITDIDKEELTLTFSQPMDDTDTDSNNVDVLTFKLGFGYSKKYITPTVGGGDAFQFTIIDKADIPASQ